MVHCELGQVGNPANLSSEQIEVTYGRFGECLNADFSFGNVAKCGLKNKASPMQRAAFRTVCSNREIRGDDLESFGSRPMPPTDLSANVSSDCRIVSDYPPGQQSLMLHF
jgi:hypothetical protein